MNGLNEYKRHNELTSIAGIGWFRGFADIKIASRTACINPLAISDKKFNSAAF
jgi:hypothetical protein